LGSGTDGGVADVDGMTGSTDIERTLIERTLIERTLRQKITAREYMVENAGVQRKSKPA
jgi:hypothetical protein